MQKLRYYIHERVCVLEEYYIGQSALLILVIKAGTASLIKLYFVYLNLK